MLAENDWKMLAITDVPNKGFTFGRDDFAEREGYMYFQWNSTKFQVTVVCKGQKTVTVLTLCKMHEYGVV